MKAKIYASDKTHKFNLQNRVCHCIGFSYCVRQNFALLPISWLPGLKISFSSFSEKLREVSKIWPNTGDSKLNSAHLKKKKLKIGSAVLEILAI